MRLDQFDKLDQNIKEIVDYVFKLKVENNRLKTEIDTLKKQHKSNSETGIENLVYKDETNDATDLLPQDKEKIVVSQLDNILGKLKNLSTGVEFK